MKTKIVNKYKEAFDVYIGRGSLFGNPFPIKNGQSRSNVIAMYKVWFYRQLKNIRFRVEVEKLKGKTLACFCKPLSCHGDIIVEYLENN